MAGRLSVDVIGIFATMLKGDMWREESLSMERGIWKCSGMRDSISSALSAMTEILPESARYAEKALSFFWSGLQCPKAYSLWGGVVPSPSIG